MDNLNTTPSEEAVRANVPLNQGTFTPVPEATRPYDTQYREGMRVGVITAENKYFKEEAAVPEVTRRRRPPAEIILAKTGEYLGKIWSAASRYWQSHDRKEMMKTVEDGMRKNPVPVMGVGFLLGTFIGKKRKKD